MFNVTMQNHGGYDPTDDPNFEERIHLTGEYEGKYPQGRPVSPRWSNTATRRSRS